MADIDLIRYTSGLAGEKEKLKASEDRFFNKMENMKVARNNVDGRAHADLDKRDKRYENRCACARVCT